MDKTLSYRHALRFSVGVKQARACRIQPIFLPFAGCPQRCVFCAQDKQTGHNCLSDEKKLFNFLLSTHQILTNIPTSRPTFEDKEHFCAQNSVAPHPLLDTFHHSTLSKPPELAFYGGTFTALAPIMLEQCLDFYTRMHQENIVSCGRCSTRPDAVSPQELQPLSDAGLDLVELGVQSFDNAALQQSQRGYTSEQAWQGCQNVKEAGLKLGIQLLPGMPGVSPEIFLRDVESALSCQPDCLRFYPCLVPDGTQLAKRWRQGTYAPWSLEETVDTLGQGLCMAWKAHVPVLRLSVAPEPSFDATVIAGPRHPALGAMIQAEALLCRVKELVKQFPYQVPELSLPRSCQGYLYGQRSALRPRWEALGFPPARIHFTDEQDAALWASL